MDYKNKSEFLDKFVAVLEKIFPQEKVTINVPESLELNGFYGSNEIKIGDVVSYVFTYQVIEELNRLSGVNPLKEMTMFMVYEYLNEIHKSGLSPKPYKEDVLAIVNLVEVLGYFN